MDNQLFRKKTLEQFSAPEQLTEYLRVTGAGVWFVLLGIIVLLTGFVIWGLFGQIITRVTVPAQVRDGTVYCYLLADEEGLTDEEVEIRIGDVQMKAKTADAQEKTLDASDDPALFRTGYLSPAKNVRILQAQTSLKDGNYEATVTTQIMKPVSLVSSK